MENTKNRVFDGMLVIPDGVDSSSSPYNLDETTCSWAVNVTFRGDYPTTRPAWIKRKVLSTDVQSGYWQGCYFYRADSGINQLVFAIGGRMYAITPNLDFLVTDLTITGDPNPSTLKFAYFVQAENYLVNNDGLSGPIIYDGTTARRAGPGEITTGTVAAYSRGRIWYAVNKGTAFRAGDLVRSSSGSQTYAYRDAVIKQTENNLINGGGDFSVPDSSGAITTMAVPASLDTSLGQGPLQVFTRTACFSVNAPVDRTEWFDTIDPVQTVSQLSSGAVSSRSSCLANGDVFYRSSDGIRSFIMARRYFQEGNWGNTPISLEVRRALDFDNIYNLEAESGVVFNNRLIHTCWGRNNNTFGIFHAGLVALDFDPVSTMRNKRQPRWEGLWTGLKILQLITGNFNGIDRCFAFVLNTGYGEQLELWELKEDHTLDNDLTPIPSNFESRGFYGETRFNRKRLESARIFVSNLVPGQAVDFQVQYKADNNACFTDWAQWSECASGQVCEEECLTGLAPQMQYRPRMGLTQPENVCNPLYDGDLRDLYQCQLKVNWTGHATINQVRVDAIELVDNTFGTKCTAQPCKSLECCVEDPTEYQAS